MKPTILLVADDDCLCEALAASLKSEGCEAVSASDLTSALSLYETFRPELVILDGDLPDTDGSDAFRQFRLRHKADHTPILMILDSPSAYTRAMEAEATDVVFRHLDLQLICFRVRCLLQLNRTIRQTRASEARLAATLRLAQLASWKWTPMDGGFALSEHAARVFRMDTIPKTFSYHDFLAAIYAPDRTLVDSALKMAVQKRKKVSVEFRIKRPNGTLGHVMLQGEPDLDVTTATFPALHGILHDATERKQSEAGHQLLKDAIDALPVGITVTDTRGGIVYANPAEAHMHGLSVTDLLALKARQLAPHRLHEEMSADKLRTMRMWRRESVNVRTDGTEFPVQLTSVGLFDTQGMPRGLATVSEDISARKDAETRIERLAYYDPLTGLPNRLLFFDRLHQALTTANRKGHRTGILFLDLDNFKDVNDTQGHDFGDKFLREVARRLSSGMREADTLARFGGDEFVVVLTTLGDTDSAAAAAQRFLALLAAPLEVEGRQVYTSASIGVALYPDDAVDSEGLLKCADSAMYQAKSEGKQNYHFFSAMTNENLVRRVELENALRGGFKEDEFSLHYQPIWDAQAGRMVGVEAFVRWDTPRFGKVLPTEFIPLAEKTGMIFDMGEWILRTACRQAKQWQAASGELRVAVNVSARQFNHPDFPERLARIMEETDFHPRWLELDCAESILLQQVDRTIATLEALKQRGISIAIDDFGSGGSSLSCLQDMPIDRLKIDRPLIANLAGPREDKRVISAILTLAQGLGMRVVAEGVETGEQFRLLTLQGCDELQGYYLGCPMSAEEFSGWLAGNGGMWLPTSEDV